MAYRCTSILVELGGISGAVTLVDSGGKGGKSDIYPRQVHAQLLPKKGRRFSVNQN
jgi:hypothetical protein